MTIIDSWKREGFKGCGLGLQEFCDLYHRLWFIILFKFSKRSKLYHFFRKVSSRKVKMAANEEMPTFKLVLVGDGGVGKVCA